MEDLSLHILDVAQNSIAAGARSVRIVIHEDAAEDTLTIEIADDGRGMDPSTLQIATDPFYTTGTTRRVGLGLPLLKEAAEAAGGTLDISSSPGAGTRVCATFRRSHIDRKPLGNMPDTIVALIAGHPDIALLYAHDCLGHGFAFSTEDLRERCQGRAINDASILASVRAYLTEQIQISITDRQSIED